MLSARRKMQLSLIDQEALIKKSQIWKQEDPSIKIFFRPKSTEAVDNDDTKGNIEVEEQEMKFKNEDSVNNDCRIEGDIEKEEEQEIKFKNEVKILSIPCYLFTKQNGKVVFFNIMVEKCYCWTQRTQTTRYVLPLFFLVVKTNVDYQIVGTFITENETKLVIKKAMIKFKEWNPSTSPKFCMTDYCNEKIMALDETFVGM